MNADIKLSCTSTGDGGVELAMSTDRATMKMPCDRNQAAVIAATILARAGISNATFKDGHITVPVSSDVG